MVENMLPPFICTGSQQSIRGGFGAIICLPQQLETRSSKCRHARSKMRAEHNMNKKRAHMMRVVPQSRSKVLIAFDEQNARVCERPRPVVAQHVAKVFGAPVVKACQHPI
jgi:hypothetical protein